MQFEFQLFIRQHGDEGYTVEVVGESGLCVHSRDLERAREDLTLVLNDRLERYHPRMLQRYAAIEAGELRVLDLEGALELTGHEGLQSASTRVSMVLGRDRHWYRVWFPRWRLHTWVPSDEALEPALTQLLQEHVARLSPDRRLGLRWQGEERVENLVVHAEAAPLSAFAGELRGREILPERMPPPAPDEDDELLDGVLASDGRRRKAVPTPTFAQIGVHLSRAAADGQLERAYGRDREVGELLDLLHVARGPSGGNYVVVGPPGVGKTRVLHELVHRLRRPENCPQRLLGRSVWFADASRLVAGAGMFGDWQQQTLQAAQECVQAELIWLIGDVSVLLDAGKAHQCEHNVAALLEPLLAGGRMTVVGECSPEAWALVERRNPGFAALFGVYRLQEPTTQLRRAMLSAVADDLARDGIGITSDGQAAIEELCARYASIESSRVGAVLALARQIVAHRAARATAAGESEAVLLHRGDVVEYFCETTGLPSFLVRDDQVLESKHVAQHFSRRLLGQAAVVARMTDLVASIKAGLGDDTRPLGSFLFVGPTGVGKTETAKALAEFLFGSPQRMVRFDLSEFMTASSVTRFIGDEHQEGRLVAAVRATPFCVILLDEIEKAHPAVFDVLLQVLGEARMTDRRGRRADFRNAVVLMTSNLGAEDSGGGLGLLNAGSRDLQSHFEARASEFFRPEFLNRIDRIIAFEPLGLSAIRAIATRELDGFRRRERIRARKLELQLGPEVGSWLAERGVDARYGARPLKRAIEQHLAVPLAKHQKNTSSRRRVEQAWGRRGPQTSGRISADLARGRSQSLPSGRRGPTFAGACSNGDGRRAARSARSARGRDCIGGAARGRQNCPGPRRSSATGRA